MVGLVLFYTRHLPIPILTIKELSNKELANKKLANKKLPNKELDDIGFSTPIGNWNELGYPQLLGSRVS